MSQNWVGSPSYYIELDYKTPLVQILNYYNFLSKQQHVSLPLYQLHAVFHIQH